MILYVGHQLIVSISILTSNDIRILVYSKFLKLRRCHWENKHINTYNRNEHYLLKHLKLCVSAKIFSHLTTKFKLLNFANFCLFFLLIHKLLINPIWIYLNISSDGITCFNSQKALLLYSFQVRKWTIIDTLTAIHLK